MNNVEQQIKDLSDKITKLELYLKKNPKNKDALRSLYVFIGRKRRLNFYLKKINVKKNKV